MTPQQIKTVTTAWRKHARKLQRQSSTTYRKLRTGELPQEDDIIYSVYELSAKAGAFEACAAELETYASAVKGGAK